MIGIDLSGRHSFIREDFRSFHEKRNIDGWSFWPELTVTNSLGYAERPNSVKTTFNGHWDSDSELKWEEGKIAGI